MALRVGGDHGSGERRAHLDGARGSPLTVDEENVIGSERDLAVDLTTSERLAVAVAVTAGAATAGAAWAAARPRARAATATAAWAVPWARAAGSFPKASSSHCSQQRRRPHCPSKVHAQQMSSLSSGRTRSWFPAKSRNGGKNGAQTCGSWQDVRVCKKQLLYKAP
jgi:hypothetical protein